MLGCAKRFVNDGFCVTLRFTAVTSKGIITDLIQ